MSVKEFWESDPDLFWAYRFSYFNKFKNEQQMINSKAWLQGAYFYEAISVALSNSFGKAGNKLKYSEKPYNFEESENSSKIEKNNNAVIELKGRVAQVQALFKNKEKTSSTAKGK